MSLYIVHTHYCDLCGSVMRNREYVCQQTPGLTLPEPMPNNFRYNGSKWDICDACFTPVKEALDKKIAEMKVAGTLVGVRTSEEIAERRWDEWNKRKDAGAQAKEAPDPSAW